MVAVEIQREGIGAAQHGVTGIGLDQSVIDDRGRRQHHRAAAGRCDLALVDDGIPATAEIVAAFDEILVGDVRCGGQQASDIDAGIVAEQDTIGIEQPDLAVGANGAVNVGNS